MAKSIVRNSAITSIFTIVITLLTVTLPQLCAASEATIQQCRTDFVRLIEIAMDGAINNTTKREHIEATCKLAPDRCNDSMLAVQRSIDAAAKVLELYERKCGSQFPADEVVAKQLVALPDHRDALAKQASLIAELRAASNTSTIRNR